MENPRRWRVQGDRALAMTYMGEVNRLFLILNNQMKLGGLEQYQMSRNYPDGTTIRIQNIFGHETATIMNRKSVAGLTYTASMEDKLRTLDVTCGAVLYAPLYYHLYDPLDPGKDPSEFAIANNTTLAPGPTIPWRGAAPVGNDNGIYVDGTIVSESGSDPGDNWFKYTQTTWLTLGPGGAALSPTFTLIVRTDEKIIDGQWWRIYKGSGSRISAPGYCGYLGLDYIGVAAVYALLDDTQQDSYANWYGSTVITNSYYLISNYTAFDAIPLCESTDTFTGDGTPSNEYVYTGYKITGNYPYFYDYPFTKKNIIAGRVCSYANVATPPPVPLPQETWAAAIVDGAFAMKRFSGEGIAYGTFPLGDGRYASDLYAMDPDIPRFKDDGYIGD